MLMILQDNGPHHLHPDPLYFYTFLVIAPDTRRGDSLRRLKTIESL